jgi:hypothetical protein
MMLKRLLLLLVMLPVLILAFAALTFFAPAHAEPPRSVPETANLQSSSGSQPSSGPRSESSEFSASQRRQARNAKSKKKKAKKPRRQARALVETDIPARLDRLPWGPMPFHTLDRGGAAFTLGITWILDGLEVTLAGSVAGALKESPVCSSPTSISASPAAPISPARCSAPVLRLADRPARPQEALLHHADGLSRRHRRRPPSPGTCGASCSSASSPARASAANMPRSTRRSRS